MENLQDNKLLLQIVTDIAGMKTEVKNIDKNIERVVTNLEKLDKHTETELKNHEEHCFQFRHETRERLNAIEKKLYIMSGALAVIIFGLEMFAMLN